MDYRHQKCNLGAAVRFILDNVLQVEINSLFEGLSALV